MVLLGDKGFISTTLRNEAEYISQVNRLVKQKRIFRLKYPKLLLFIISIILAYFYLNDSNFIFIGSYLNSLGYMAYFLLGLLFSFGFSTPFAIVFLLQLSPSNILLAAIIGGIGALISDLLIFKVIKISFEDEFRKLRRERPFLFIKKEFNQKIKTNIRQYLLLAFSGFLFASPIPNEVAVMVLTGISNINEKKLAIISFIFNTLGIFLILLF